MHLAFMRLGLGLYVHLSNINVSCYCYYHYYSCEEYVIIKTQIPQVFLYAVKFFTGIFTR